MFEAFTDVVPSFFGTLNRGPMTLTLFLHGLIILPIFFLYRIEKKKQQRGDYED